MIKLSDVMNGEQKKKKNTTGVGSLLCRALCLSRLHDGERIILFSSLWRNCICLSSALHKRHFLSKVAYEKRPFALRLKAKVAEGNQSSRGK